MSKKLILALLLLGSWMNVNGFSNINQIAVGLGNPSGVTFLKTGFLDGVAKAENWDGYIFYEWSHLPETTASYWTTTGGMVYAVLKNNYDAVRLYITVNGPGTLTFDYQVSVWYFDSFTWYLDGHPVGSDSFYEPNPQWVPEELSIITGLNTDVFEADDPSYSLNVNNNYHDTNTHVIVFEFWRGEDSIADYLASRPNPDDYVGMPEYYYEDLAAWKSLQNKVSLRNLVWTPTPLTFGLSAPDNTEFDNNAVLGFTGNFTDFGYLVKYTTDGTAPTTSNGLVYKDENGIVLNSPCTVWGRVFKVVGTTYTQMGEAKATYSVRVAQPTIALGGLEDNGLRIKLECLTDGTKIRYTLDGSTPTENSGKLYTEAFLLTSSATVTAIAFKEEFTNSNATIAEYPQVAAPTYTIFDSKANQIDETVLDPNSVTFPLGIFMLCATAGANIRYTSDNTNPGLLSPSYDASQPLVCEQKKITLKMRAYSSAGSENPKVPSPIVSLTIHIADQTRTYARTSADGQLQAGWNAIGIDLYLPPLGQENLFNSLPALREQDGSLITQPTTLQAGKAYWLFLTAQQLENLTIEIKGAARENFLLAKGWHFLAGKVNPDNTQLAWRWSGEKFEAILLSEMLTTEGYWYYAEDNTQTW